MSIAQIILFEETNKAEFKLLQEKCWKLKADVYNAEEAIGLYIDNLFEQGLNIQQVSDITDLGFHTIRSIKYRKSL